MWYNTSHIFGRCLLSVKYNNNDYCNEITDNIGILNKCRNVSTETYLQRSNEITSLGPGGFGVVGPNLPWLQGL